MFTNIRRKTYEIIYQAYKCCYLQQSVQYRCAYSYTKPRVDVCGKYAVLLCINGLYDFFKRRICSDILGTPHYRETGRAPYEWWYLSEMGWLKPLTNEGPAPCGYGAEVPRDVSRDLRWTSRAQGPGTQGTTTKRGPTRDPTSQEKQPPGNSFNPPKHPAPYVEKKVVDKGTIHWHRELRMVQ